MPKLKHKIHITSKDFYDFYANTYFREGKKGKGIKKRIIYTSKYYLTRQMYTRILETINKKLMDSIVNEAMDCTLTSRLGIICIRKKKPKCEFNEAGEFINNMPINWKETRKYWRENPEAMKNKQSIRHTNLHSGQWVGRFMWVKSHCNLTNKSAYSFKPCRTATENLAKIFKNEDREVDYFPVKVYIKPRV